MRVADYDIRTLSERQLTAVRGSTISMIFQEPMTALDPVYTIGDQIAETVMRHEGCSHKAAHGARAGAAGAGARCPRPSAASKAYPHELSGGLRQRAMIAMALSCRPSLLLADEPTTALDATVQIQVLILLRKLQQELGMGVIFVTHDLGVAAQIADQVAVMYAGRIVEYGNVRDVLMRPTPPLHAGHAGLDRAWRPVARHARSRRSPAARPTCAGCRPAAPSRRAANTRTRAARPQSRRPRSSLRAASRAASRPAI